MLPRPSARLQRGVVLPVEGAGHQTFEVGLEGNGKKSPSCICVFVRSKKTQVCVFPGVLITAGEEACSGALRLGRVIYHRVRGAERVTVQRAGRRSRLPARLLLRLLQRGQRRPGRVPAGGRGKERGRLRPAED